VSHLKTLYGSSLALLTDLYQLTMAYGYHRSGLGEHEGAFHLIFRQPPFGGGFTVACGVHSALELLEQFRFDADDISYLASLKGNDGAPLFDEGFLANLADLRFTGDVDAVPEGTVVFPQEPLLRVTGPLIECQLLETALLNLVNFQTLVATKAARICLAARGEPVLEFGLRRAQGVDGGVTASRAAYVGGCSATSNVLAGKLFGIPVKGTHAHSWVMCFDDERASFEAYAEAMPNNCIFLVDTYDTIQGVQHAIDVGRGLRARGHEMVGIRLDSGDLADLSQRARTLLDGAGFPNCAIVASNDLDEYLITSLKTQGAAIGVWGVGTRLATAYDQPALGGVYKLAALRAPNGDWEPKIKLSEQAGKISNPGLQQVRRFWDGQNPCADVIYLDGAPPADEAPWVLVDPFDHTRRQELPGVHESEDLLVPMVRGGQGLYDPPSTEDVRARVQAQIAALPKGLKRFENPHRYPVGLERGLYDLRLRLIFEARGMEA
jgi:nicotinate phosphoribosyltransferase